MHFKNVKFESGRRPYCFLILVFIVILWLLVSRVTKYNSWDEWFISRCTSVGNSEGCYWFATQNYFGDKMRLCLAGDNDNISNFVRFFGRFYDCDDVEIAVVERNATSYLNIGSNIGVCVAAVGTHFDVVVSAIEPLQRNFFYLSQTAKLLPTYTNIHNFGLSSTFTYDHLFPDTDFDVVSLHYKSEACEIVCGALVSITRGKWKYLQTEMNYAKPKNNVCDKRTYMTILENLGFVQTGKGTVYPFLSYVITLTESYYYEWHGAIDSKVILASEICRKLLP